jgi:hypothetical protein
MDAPLDMRLDPSITETILTDPRAFLPEAGPSNDNERDLDRGRERPSTVLKVCAMSDLPPSPLPRARPDPYRWPTLGEVIWEMVCSSWDEPGNHSLSYVVDESYGLVVATAIFGPDETLLVTVSDGRRHTFPLPEFSRQASGKDG